MMRPFIAQVEAMSNATAFSRSHLFLIGLAGAGASLSLLAFALWLAVGPFYAARHAVMLGVLGPFVAAIVFGVYAGSSGRIDRDKRWAVGALTAFFTMVVGLVLATGLPQFRDHELAWKAIERAQVAALESGRPVSIMPVLVDATSSHEQMKAHRELLEQVAQAKVRKHEVAKYLVMAQALDVDASFVVQNMMVRPQDEEHLYNHVIERARAGDQVAAQWLGLLESP